jgi:hypothetical protein
MSFGPFFLFSLTAFLLEIHYLITYNKQEPFEKGSHLRNSIKETLKMKLITILGILLTAVGVISLIYQGLPFTTREKVIDFGPLQAYKEEKKTIPIPPIIGVLAIGSGILLIVAGVRKK